MELLGREIIIKKKEKKKVKSEALPTFTAKSFDDFVAKKVAETGKTEAQIVEETFHDGFLTFMVEESGGSTKIDASQMFQKTVVKEDMAEIIRLRKKFSPVSTCVDWIRDNILGSGIGVQIDNNKSAFQKTTKTYIEKFIDDVYQDEYTRSLQVILPILVDEALTTGVAAAEIVYEKPDDLTFMKFAKVSEENSVVKIKGKDTEVVYFEVKEPDWTKLKGIARLKIMDEAYRRFELQRDMKTWDAKYWNIDGPEKDGTIKLDSGLKIKKFVRDAPKGEYLHTWQVFWVVLKRSGALEKGDSVIRPALFEAQLLEKILKAVGEGIYRAGNKKYFIVCGTEKRPWSGPHIRNVLQQLREASQKNWSTIPMPRGFSVEEMGGEIFEATEVVSYFKKLIARAMHVPASVLGVGDADKEAKTNLTLLKVNLALAIKHQLFRHHIWCRYGKTKGKQGGKGEKDTYVPKARFKIESLLSMAEELDLYKTMLNPANPVSGPVKLEVERGICKLMGWDHVLLPTQEEFKKEQEELKKQMDKKLAMQDKQALADKKQGPPVPQTAERQEKRLEGMTKKAGSKKGVAKDLGGTRKPKEEKIVQESTPIPIPTPPKEIEKIVRVASPTDEIMIELATERKELAEKQKELVELKKTLTEEESKRKQNKIQKEIKKLETEISGKNAEIEKINKEIEKTKIETEEIKKTHEEKRRVIKRADEAIQKEEKLLDGGEE